MRMSTVSSGGSSYDRPSAEPECQLGRVGDVRAQLAIMEKALWAEDLGFRVDLRIMEDRPELIMRYLIRHNEGARSNAS